MNTWLVVLVFSIMWISGDTEEHKPLEFVEQFEDTFSDYIFGYKNCYYYRISHDVTNHCSPIVDNDTGAYEDSAADIDMDSTESGHHSILETNNWKRLLLNNAKNTHCYIATLYLCPSRSTYEAKQFAMKHIHIPSQTCFETNIISGKTKHSGKGIGIQIFKSEECEVNEESPFTPFILCTDGSHSTTEDVEFCFNGNDEAQCVHDVQIPDICNGIYDTGTDLEANHENGTDLETTSASAFAATTTDHNHDMKVTKVTKQDNIGVNQPNDGIDIVLTPGKSRWLIGVLGVIGICILSMLLVLCAWSVIHHNGDSYENNENNKDHQHDAFDHFDETIEYDDGRELVQRTEFDSDELNLDIIEDNISSSVWQHMLYID